MEQEYFTLYTSWGEMAGPMNRMAAADALSCMRVLPTQPRSSITIKKVVANTSEGTQEEVYIDTIYM